MDPKVAVQLGLDPWDTPIAALADFFVVAVAFGGGLNSTALLVRWVREGAPPPQRITFADTGCERAETYAHVARFSDWLTSKGFPPILITRKGGRPETLEGYALRTKHLPSIAYGMKSCSSKFKIEPQDRDINRWDLAQAAWKAGTRVVKVIGYGAEEQRRISRAKLDDEKYFYRFPLDEWQMHREDCVSEIEAAGLPVPPKSSCFFCPSMTKPEIERLAPEYKVRALFLEQTAIRAGNARTVKGLGRKFAWSDHLAGLQTADGIQESCMYCVDGSAE